MTPGRQAPALRDWLGWLFAVLLTLIGALSTIAWNELKDRIDRLELYGSTPLRLDVSRIMSQLDELQRRIDTDEQLIDDLRQQTRVRPYRDDQNSGASSGPRFAR